MNRVRITRPVRVPDPLRINRYRRAPELGPAILFFSGGSALNDLSRVLKGYTHNSIHLVTPFDGGGSSSALRRAFHMPSIGDLRSRLMALVDESVTGHPEICRLFNHRLPHNRTNRNLCTQLDDMLHGGHRLMDPIGEPMRRLIRNQLGFFLEAMPADFDLRGASIGNLILAGGYLNNHHDLDPIVFLFSKMVGVCGTVRTVVTDDLHLGAELSDGRLVIGQQLLTGKETPPLDTPIERLFLSSRPDACEPAEAVLKEENRALIAEAELIVFPPGSFYSSLLANLLPQGVAAAVAANECPKVFIPNLGRDPEQIGMTGDQAVMRLLDQLRGSASGQSSARRPLDLILTDSANGEYASSFSAELMAELGIQVVDTRLVSRRSAPYYDPELLASALLSLT